MKLLNPISIFSILVFHTLILSSCNSTPTKVTASFIMPPRAIEASNLKKINTLKIEIDATCSSNGNFQDSSFISGILRERLAERLYQEGYYHISDIIWGDLKGSHSAFEIARVANTGHGYSDFYTDSHDHAATLKLSFNGTINSSTKVAQQTFTLHKIPYRQYVDKNGVPRSMPDYKEVPVTDKNGSVQRDEQGNIIYNKIPIIIETQQTVQFNYPECTASCLIHAVITDSEGNEIYERSFENSFEENGLLNHQTSRPTDAEIIARLFSDDKVVGELINDISPSKTKRELVVNKNGDKKAVLLLNANAVTEAADYLEALINVAEQQNKENKADYENLGLAYEILGDFSGAENAYQKADCKAGLNRIAELRNASRNVVKVKKQLQGFKSDKK